MRNIIASLDVGSSLIKLVVGEINRGKFNVLLALNTPSQGVKNGYVINQESFNVVINDLFNKAEEILGIRVRKIIVSVPSTGSKCELVEGYTTITSLEKVVSSQDIVRSMQAAVYNKVPDNMELVNVIPIKFRIDDDQTTNYPLGLSANKLASKCILVTVPKKGILPLLSVLDKNGLEVIDLQLTTIGDYEELRTKDTDESVCAIVNIGDSLTTVGIFTHGVISATDTINAGSSNIDKDLSYVYKISPGDALTTKENLCLCHTRLAQASESVELVNFDNEKVKLNQYDVSEIAYERIKEIFNLIKKQINILTKKEISYIIITGGLSEADNFDLIVEESFGLKASIADVCEIGARNNIYSSAIGMIKFYYRKLKLRNKNFSIFTEEEQEQFGGLNKSKNAENGNIINKVFSIFFDN